MNVNLPSYVFLIIAIVYLIISLSPGVVPLISKIIENRHQKRLKALEVILNRKLDCFTDYIKTASEFGYMAQKDSSEYNEYLKCYYTAKLIASPKVKDAMKEVAQAANVMRTAGGLDNVAGLEKLWQDAFDKATEEMAKEIEILAEIKS